MFVKYLIRKCKSGQLGAKFIEICNRSLLPCIYGPRCHRNMCTFSNECMSCVKLTCH